MRYRIILTVIISLSLLCYSLCGADSPPPIAIRAGKIWTVTSGVITDGVIVVKDGKIEAAGKDIRIPKDARILDMPDKSVMPGMIDAHCHLGLSLDVQGEIEEGVLAVTPDMQILDAFDPASEHVKRALGSGVTTVLLSPGYENPIAGQAAIVKLYGAGMDDWMLNRDAGVKFSLENYALKSDRQPTSRPGLMALVREELDKAKAYQGKKLNPCSEVLRRSTDGKLPVYISCSTVDEIVAAITIIDEYKLDAALVNAREGDEAADMIAERNIPVIYSPLLLLSKDKDLRRVAKMADAGVRIAFMSAAPLTDPRDLRTSAIIAVKYGLSPEAALKSLTINAAEILGIDERVGSIEKGKDADLVILSGDPMELTSGVEMVIINGEIVYSREER